MTYLYRAGGGGHGRLAPLGSATVDWPQLVTLKTEKIQIILIPATFHHNLQLSANLASQLANGL